jgi:hypothetical protein
MLIENTFFVFFSLSKNKNKKFSFSSGCTNLFFSLSLSPIKPALAHEAKTHTERQTDRHTVRRCHHQHGGRVRAFHPRGTRFYIFWFFGLSIERFFAERARARFFSYASSSSSTSSSSLNESLADRYSSLFLFFSLSLASGAGLPPGGREQRFIGKDEPNR